MKRRLLAADNRVTIVDRISAAGPAAFGRTSLVRALAQQGIEVTATGYRAPGDNEVGYLHIGMLDDVLTRRVLEANEILPRREPEGIVTAWCKVGETGEALVIAGTDERGLMYGLLDAASRVRAAGIDALENCAEGTEYPEHGVRGVYQFLMGSLDRSWYDSEDFWHYYFERLASSRFNRFVLVMGFDTGYLSPPYPFFVSVADYPDVRVRDLSEEGRRSNLDHLRHIIDLAHDHGLEFILGTWQQAPWVKEEELLVENLPEEEERLGDYCAEGMKSLLAGLPALDGIHFRVNHEAGVGTQTSNEAFWRKMVHAVAEARNDIKLDLRAKGLTDTMIRDALETGLSLSVPTKYWCEHAGLPHHLTQMRAEELTQLENFNHSRRYSYADMLKRPRPYDLVYRLWNNGTTSFLLWSDPDYVRRFMASCHLGGAAGYEVSAPLALRWGHSALQNEAWPLFEDPALRSGSWDDDRYWLFYTLFGRIGYAATVSEEVWEREILARYPREALDALKAAYGASGKILPLVTAFHMPVHPQLSYWPEVSTGGALFVENSHRSYRYLGEQMSYATSEPSDPGLFYRICDYVDDELAGTMKPKYTPLQVRRWLWSFAGATRHGVHTLDAVPGMPKVADYPAARLDFLMLADLAEYHVHKVQAAVDLCLYEKRGERPHLVSALANMRRAAGSWKSLAERGGETYHSDLVFQAGSMNGGRMGHWRDWVPEVEKDVSSLAALLGDASDRQEESEVPENPGLETGISDLASVSASVPETWEHGHDLPLEITLDPLTRSEGKWNLHYRRANQLEGAFKIEPMRETQNGFRTVIRGDYLTPEWDLLLYFSSLRPGGRTQIYPGLYHSDHPMPYLTVRIR